MSVITRGIKNTFRSGLRTTAFAVILAVSIGLAFSMLLANRAMDARISSLRKQIGNVVIINPAGVQGTQGVGKPLKDADIAKVRKLSHVISVDSALSFAAEGSAGNAQNKAHMSVGGDQGEKPIETSLAPAVTWQDIDKNAPKDLPPPAIVVDGLSGKRNSDSKQLVLAKGRYLKSGDTYSALIGKAIAEKNKLTLSGTFTIDNKTFTVVGIFDAGGLFGNSSVKIPLKTAQALTKRTGEAQTAIAQIDSIDNLEAVQNATKSALGKDRVDITTTQPNALIVVNSLRSVQNVSVIALVVALAAAGLTIFLTMLVVVRERSKEIGVLKALGASNVKIILQFMTEATVLTLIGTAMGIGLAALSGNAILHGLLSSQFDGSPTAPGAAAATAGMTDASAAPQTVHQLVANLSTLIDYHLLMYGLLVAVGIALVGSAIPAWFITRIRPAEVMRGNQ